MRRVWGHEMWWRPPAKKSLELNAGRGRHSGRKSPSAQANSIVEAQTTSRTVHDLLSFQRDVLRLQRQRYVGGHKGLQVVDRAAPHGAPAQLEEDWADAIHGRMPFRPKNWHPRRTQAGGRSDALATRAQRRGLVARSHICFYSFRPPPRPHAPLAGGFTTSRRRKICAASLSRAPAGENACILPQRVAAGRGRGHGCAAPQAGCDTRPGKAPGSASRAQAPPSPLLSPLLSASRIPLAL